MWLDTQVSFYDTHNDNRGRAATLREILFCEFIRDLDALIDLRQLDATAPEYKKQKKALKDTLQGYTPAAVLTARGLTEEEKDQGLTIDIKVVQRTGIISIDFDQLDDYDLDEVKQAIGALPFVGYCGLSASGQGLFALVLIAEPERQREYVEHLFEVFKNHGLPPDTTKGRNVNDLRYVSYDSRPVINDNPEPLRIKFRPKAKKKTTVNKPVQWGNSSNLIVKNGIERISQAQVGQRWQTVQQVAYTFGGLNDTSLLSVIKDAIKNNSAFTGEEDKYCKCANECFAAGKLKPLMQSV